MITINLLDWNLVQVQRISSTTMALQTALPRTYPIWKELCSNRKTNPLNRIWKSYYKQATISIILLLPCDYCLLYNLHITSICTSYLSLLTRKHRTFRVASACYWDEIRVLTSIASRKAYSLWHARTREYSLHASGGTLTRGWYCI